MEALPTTSPCDGAPDLAAVLAGDCEAVAAFAAEIGATARRLLLGVGLSPADAEALAVTCVTEIFLRLHQFRGESLSGWVRTIVLNLFRDELRTARHSVVAVPDETAETRASSQTARRRAAPEVRRAVAAALARLSPDDLLIIQLRYCAEPVAYREIAALLNTGEGALRVRCLRLREKLETLLRADPRLAERICRWETSTTN